MAEALGIAASIIAVLQITTQVASLSYQYLSGVKRAPEDLQKLTYELKSLITILSTLQVCAQDAQSIALRELGDPLQECLADMVKLHDKLKPKKSFLARLKWPFEEKETSGYLSRIERLKALFILALEADQLGRTKLIAEDVQDIKAGVENLSTAQEFDKQQKKIDKRRNALEWLYPEPFEKRHNEISSRRRKNTGRWIFQTPEVQEWIRGNKNCRLLWGYGIPGAGKTFLSSLVVDEIEERASAANYGVAYIYFSYQEQEQQTPINILTSVVKQLASRIQGLPKKIEEAYDRHKRPTLDQLYSIILDITSSFVQTFVICDALDECNQGSQRKELLPLFHRMGKAVTSINLFLTSREHPEDIQHSFKDITRIRLSAKDEDIEAYIEQKIAENPRAERLVGQGKCKDRIISDIKECANGMFLLVHFHIEHLCQQTTVRQILLELERLKSSLNEEHPMDPTYNRAMEILRLQPKNCVQLAFKVLSWLVKGRQILTVRELQIAVSVDQHRTTFDELDLPDRKTLLDVCASLVTIDEISDTIRLVHYTAQEFLVNGGLLPEDADFQLAMACTTFLSYDIPTSGPYCFNGIFSITYPFLRYASKELQPHLKACNETLTTDIVLRLLQRPENIHSYMHANVNYSFNFNGQCAMKTDTPLYVAATLGHFSVTEILLKRSTKDINVCAWGGGETPLGSAAARGHESVVQLLLRYGANISTVNGYGDTALFGAAYGGHTSIVQLLLENQANVSAQDRSGGTALARATIHGHEPVVQILLKYGASVSAIDNSGDTALSQAASWGHESVVRTLLANGADVSTTNIYGDTPLFQAIYSRSESVVRLLLENGCDFSSTNGDGETPLSQAASEGDEPVIRLLLESGASVSTTDNHGYTPLLRAVSRGHESAVRLLLENGANVSTVNKEGDTALSLAAYMGRESVVKLLLESGASISTTDKDGETPLSQAASQGHEPVVRLLLESGASVSTTDRDGDTPLLRAVDRGHESVVRLLLENGANISTVNKEGDTALSLAAYIGRKSVVKLLLESGASVSTTDKDGETALSQAASRGYESVVRLLLENGANLSTVNKEGDTALSLAAYSGKKSVVQLMLENGADVSAVNKYGCTALSGAAYSGHASVVQLLLDNGADITAVDEAGDTALSRAAYCGRVSTVEVLLTNGANISTRNKDGNTALSLAAYSLYPSVVQVLLKNGADISAVNNDGDTALSLAAYAGRVSVVRELLENGAGVSTVDGDGVAVLLLAAREGHGPVVQLLLENGADVSTIDGDGDTALSLAAYGGHKSVVQLLLKNGADISTKNKNGHTPLYLAESMEHRSVVQLLVDHLSDDKTRC